MQIDADDIGAAVGDPYAILDDDGDVLEGREVPAVADERLVEMYAEMAFARHFDERAVSLQRQGRIGTYPPIAGQEAAQIASTYALRDGDWVVPTYRESAVCLARGVDASSVLRYWMGHEPANADLADEHVLPFNIGIGSLVPHATGLGMAVDYRDDDSVVVCHFGDGATSEGDVHEGMNFAGVFDTPTVFFCNNNQWAISVPREKQTASTTIAQKALAYGFDGVRVDGMDPLAVYDVTQRVVANARADDGGPTLVEAVQYRYGAHTTADDPSVYRDDEEVERWRAKDPLDRMESFLLNTGRVDEERIDAIETANRERMAHAIEAAEAAPDGDPTEMFDDVFAERTAELDAQRASMTALRETFGDDALLED